MWPSVVFTWSEQLCHLVVLIYYRDFSQLYTDGSKVGNQVAAAVFHGNVTKATRLPNKASIFRAELHGISLALSLICCNKEKNFIIFYRTPSQAWKI